MQDTLPLVSAFEADRHLEASIRNGVDYIRSQSNDRTTVRGLRSNHELTHDLTTMSVEELTLALDANLSSMAKLVQTRKQLCSIRRSRIIEQQQKQLQSNYKSNVLFTQQGIFRQIVQSILPSLQHYNDGLKRQSDEFWQQNDRLESKIDAELFNLKLVDQNLERHTTAIVQFCSQLDSLEHQLKQILNHKSSDYLAKAESIHNKQKSILSLINSATCQSEQAKQDKRRIVQDITQWLRRLIDVRNNRVTSIKSTLKADLYHNQYLQCIQNLDCVLNAKQERRRITTSESHLSQRIHEIDKVQSKLINELFKSYFDEQEIYSDYQQVVTDKICNAKVIQIHADTIQYADSKLLWNQQNQLNYNCLKSIVGTLKVEEKLMKQGISNTKQTLQSFEHISVANQTNQSKRQSLMLILGRATALMDIERQTNQRLHQTSIDLSRIMQQRQHIQYSMQSATGDLELYKKHLGKLDKCQAQLSDTIGVKKLIQNEAELLQLEMIQIGNTVVSQYNQIMSQYFPAFHTLRPDKEGLITIKRYMQRVYSLFK